MPKYVLTGADGKLGRVAADFALEIAQPDDELVFTTYQRSLLPDDVVASWEARGARVVEASYDDAPESLAGVFAGAAAVSFISTWASGRRREQAANVIEACRRTGDSPRLVYTSFVGAGAQGGRPEAEQPVLVRDHAAIERQVKESGLPYNLQRNCLYADNVAELFAPAWAFCGGAWLDNSHHVRGAYVARADCARVHAALLLGRGKPNHAYDVTGPELVTDGQMMDWVCSQTGYQCEMVDVSDAELRRWWAAKGVPDAVGAGPFPAGVPMPLCLDDLVCCGRLVADGYMQEITDTVEKLTGRPPRCFRQTLIHYKDAFPRAEDTSDCDHAGTSREEER